jgi:hypothetical protein
MRSAIGRIEQDVDLKAGFADHPRLPLGDDGLAAL